MEVVTSVRPWPRFQWEIRSFACMRLPLCGRFLGLDLHRFGRYMWSDQTSTKRQQPAICLGLASRLSRLPLGSDLGQTREVLLCLLSLALSVKLYGWRSMKEQASSLLDNWPTFIYLFLIRLLICFPVSSLGQQNGVAASEKTLFHLSFLVASLETSKSEIFILPTVRFGLTSKGRHRHLIPQRPPFTVS